MKRILVTGGAGFIGSHLVRRLLSNGARVSVLDDVSTGSWANLESHPNLDKIECDVSADWDVEVDSIYHLACPASPDKYQIDPIRTLRTNFIGTQNVLEAARRHKARVLLTSTSEVYGDPDVSPQSEAYFGNVNSFGPRSCYDEGKRVAEALCYSYATTQDVVVRIARIFNTYGPQMAVDDGRVVSNFLVQALENKPLTIYGDGSQTRSLCYVDDLVEGLMRLMDLSGGPLMPPVNLGNPHEMTVRQIAEAAISVVNQGGSLEFRPLPQDDPRRRRPDISRAQELLDWRPAVSLEIGLRKTCDYFRGALHKSAVNTGT